MQIKLLAVLLSIALVAVAEAKKHHHGQGHHKQHHAEHKSHLDSRGHDDAHQIGVPWGCDPTCIKGLKSTRRTDVVWYQHWQDTRVPELDQLGFDYVPSFWGPSKWDRWNAVKAEISKGPLPTYMLAMNEPDVQGQADLGPKAAAKLWMQELKPFADKGVQVSSPQMCWNMQWLEQFMSECKKLGCNMSFIALHWYGSWRDFDKFTHWISSVHDAYNLPIWVTEYGVTQASGGSQAQIKDFHVRAVEWMRQTGYVKRSAWLGGFPVNQKPDPYPSSLNSYFNGDGSARDLLWWVSQSAGGSWLSFPGIHRRDTESSPEQHKDYKDDDVKKAEHEQYDEDHCDYKCQLRQGSIEKHHRKRKGVVEVNDGKVCVATPSKLGKEECKKLSTCLKHAGLLSNNTHHLDTQMKDDVRHVHVGAPKQANVNVS
ncbi:hypothetical protein PHSY_005281 [Pseudozyma hubeiensis SY62]|uniref:Asl1-like glycosyl hydrolase catalytic domain-containing protein n=1 Tax=Pseudozyma hubeiensis (strain SY62) TaxID=1305764 RepID=R9P8M1_PSEHS|nr:hypothetical protein PHSY_005281 [Pseudozyma hubeiensis SY62]GAC97694.1 hypothetical protein PHSY_005281 [Pseudozyma hubeiensis SY62]